MLKRVYCPLSLKKYVTYTGCEVCSGWLTFSVFRSWMETQDWEDKELDKDLLYDGNKIYSATTCIFVPRDVNVFTNSHGHGARNKDSMMGCCWMKKLGKYSVRCGNPLTKKEEYLGLFISDVDGNLAWKSRKLELAYELIEYYKLPDKLAAVLINKYK